MNTIDPEVKATLSKYRDAKRLRDTLKSRFSIVNGPRIQQIKSTIARCEQPKTMPITTYFGKLTALWEELNNYKPLITCSCCTSCTAGQQHEKRRENTRLHQFFMGSYPDYFSQTRANILSTDPLPSLDRAYQLLIQDKRVRQAKSATEERPPEALGFVARSSMGRGKSDDQRERQDKSHLHCTNCKKSGHLVSGCFELIGYPDWWPNQSKAQGGGAGRGRPSPSSGRGRGDPARANATNSNPAAFNFNHQGQNMQAAGHVFTPEQWKILAGFIGNTKVYDERLTGEFDFNS